MHVWYSKQLMKICSCVTCVAMNVILEATKKQQKHWLRPLLVKSRNLLNVIFRAGPYFCYNSGHLTLTAGHSYVIFPILSAVAIKSRSMPKWAIIGAVTESESLPQRKS